MQNTTGILIMYEINLEMSPRRPGAISRFNPPTVDGLQ
jgi:hypothetical protein